MKLDKNIPQVSIKTPVTTEKHTKKTNKIAEKASLNVGKVPSGAAYRAMLGIQTTQEKPLEIPEFDFKTADDYVRNTPIMGHVSKTEIDRLVDVLCSKTEDAANAKMHLDLIKSGDISPKSVMHYWADGKMNEHLVKDMRMITEAREAGKNVADVYVPTLKTPEEGVSKREIGDVFEVEGSKNIYVKTDESSAKQLKMDKEMFVKLFPPAQKFVTQQQNIGDCYLVSTLGSVMNNPKARVALYDAFEQNGKDVTVKFKNGFGEYKYENAELPQSRVKDYGVDGSMGIKILEDAYGLDSVNKADTMFRKIMNDKIAKKEQQVKDAAGSEKEKLQKILDGHKQRLNDYIEAKNDKSRQIVVCRDDNKFNIYYEEDKYGLIFKDLQKDPDNKKYGYKSEADFYRGSLGGYEFEVLQRLGFGGFRQMNLKYDRQEVEKLMEKNDFNSNYIMTGGTKSSLLGIESELDSDKGLYAFHAYTLEPKKDGNELKVSCTNPWNTAYKADISLKKFFRNYDSVSIVDINSYGKNLPLEEQPIKYGKHGPITGLHKSDTPVVWYVK